MKPKKIVIAVSMEEDTYKPLLQLKEMELAPDVEIHLVHVMPIIFYARGMSVSALRYPLPEEQPLVEKHVNAVLMDIKNEIFPSHENAICRCLFDKNEKEAFTEYVKNTGADLVIVATRGKSALGRFFDSSFAQYQVKHSPVNVLVLR